MTTLNRINTEITNACFAEGTSYINKEMVKKLILGLLDMGDKWMFKSQIDLDISYDKKYHIRVIPKNNFTNTTLALLEVNLGTENR